jgi:hypothetical protein
MTLRPDVEALLQGAVDNTLTPEERDTLRMLMAESVEVRGRAAHLEQLSELLDSLGAADAPPRLVHDVLAQISNSTRQQPVVTFSPRSSTVPKRGVTVNKTMIFGLAAAAAVVLAVITYTNYPPATEGTEATIGAAQRAQAPQIAPADVKLGDQSSQELLQSDTWDAIMKDEDLRSTLEDAEMRKILEDAEMRKALQNDAIQRGLKDPELLRRLKAQLSSAKKGALTEAEARGISNANVRAVLTNDAIGRALLNSRFAESLMSGRGTKALSGEAMVRLLRDAKFEQALRNGSRLEASLRSGTQTAR